MRPGDFSPGNAGADLSDASCDDDASMRPGDFSPGNDAGAVAAGAADHASMRPGDFSPGNFVIAWCAPNCELTLQ